LKGTARRRLNVQKMASSLSRNPFWMCAERQVRHSDSPSTIVPFLIFSAMLISLSNRLLAGVIAVRGKRPDPWRKLISQDRAHHRRDGTVRTDSHPPGL
jgi:hypothetical protein